MSEIRRDPISGRLVIFATERSKRPAAFAGKGGGANGRAAVPAYLEGCPFCAGNERMTPRSSWRWGAARRNRILPDGGSGLCRTSTPAVMLEEKGTPDFRGALSPGYGAHELLIEIPEHNLQPGSFPPRQMELVVEAYYRRGRALANYRRLRYLQIFRNHRREAAPPLNIPTPSSSLFPLFLPPSGWSLKVHTRLTLPKGSALFAACWKRRGNSTAE